MRRDLELGAVPLRLNFRGRANPVRPRTAAKANFTLFRLVLRMVGPRPSDREGGARALSDERPDIVDWAHFEKSRAELGPGFIRILSYFKEDGVKSIAQIEQRDARTEHDRAGASRAYAEGRSTPARRRAAGQDRRADRIDRALLHRDPPFPRRAGARSGRASPAVQRNGRAVRKGDQSAADPRRRRPVGFGRKVNNQGFGRI